MAKYNLSMYVWTFSALCMKGLALSRCRSLSYRNQCIDLQSKSMDGFLYDRDLRHGRIKQVLREKQQQKAHYAIILTTKKKYYLIITTVAHQMLVNL